MDFDDKVLVCLILVLGLVFSVLMVASAYKEVQLQRQAMENGYEQVIDSWGRTVWKKVKEE